MSVADRVWAQLHAYHAQDPDGILRGLVDGLCAPFELVDQVVSEQEDGTGPYGLLLDIDNVPDALLPYAGAYAGVTDRGQTRDALRAEIRDRPRFRRGTPASIISAAQTVLTGAKTVRLLEQSNGPFVATIVTRTTETPAGSVVLDAIRAADVVPYGIRLDHTVTDAPLIADGTRTINAGEGTIDSATLAQVTA